MQVAVRLAQRGARHGEVPVGAVAVYEGRIIARAHNLVQRWQQPLAHAEALCVLQAQKRLHSKYLSGVSVYSTLQPCALCWQILVAARVQSLYFGAYDTSAPDQGWPTVVGGVQETACAHLLHTFFQMRR